MKHDSDPQERAALYVLDLLDLEEKREFAEQLEKDESLRQQVRQFTESAAQLGVAAPGVDPPRSLKAKVLNKTLSGAWHGMHVVRSDEGRWAPSPFPGVSVKKLFAARDLGVVTCLLKMEPGSRYPAHRHTSSELCLVVEGDVSFGDKLTLKAGDFEAAVAGTIHGTISTRDGCVLLIVASPHDEILAET